LDTNTCKPLSNAVVDLWHCDADGIYSHYINASEGHHGGTDNSTFLRGILFPFFIFSSYPTIHSQDNN